MIDKDVLSIEAQIKLFEDTYPAIENERKLMEQEIFEILKKKLDEIKPVITFLKKKRFKFQHPDVESLTEHGVIIGRSASRVSIIFVYDTTPLVKAVDTYKDIIIEDQCHHFSSFLKTCDPDFAVKGIEYAKTYISILLDEMKESNASIKSALTKLRNSESL